MTDHELFERLQSGDEAAFDTIFRTSYPALVALADRMLERRAIAEEIAQDVLAEIWRRRTDLVLTGSLRAYLFRAARNRALNHIRHDRTSERGAAYLSSGHVPPDAPAQLAEDEIDAAVRNAVACLPTRCREVFELSRGHGLSYAEVAETLGISVKTVEVHMGKALRILRERLAPWLPTAGHESASDRRGRDSG